MTEEKKESISEEELTNQSTAETAETAEQQAVQEEEAETTAELENVTAVVAKLNEQLMQMTDKYLRLQAEFDNYRKRTLKERSDLIKTSGEKIFIEMLPVIDNLDRALITIDKSSDLAALKEGVEIIHKGFMQFLNKHGVKELPCKGEDFNVDMQEAISKIPAPTPDLKGKVVDCVEKGYELNEKIIRYAKVVVGE